MQGNCSRYGFLHNVPVLSLVTYFQERILQTSPTPANHNQSYGFNLQAKSIILFAKFYLSSDYLLHLGSPKTWARSDDKSRSGAKLLPSHPSSSSKTSTSGSTKSYSSSKCTWPGPSYTTLSSSPQHSILQELNNRVSFSGRSCHISLLSGLVSRCGNLVLVFSCTRRICTAALYRWCSSLPFISVVTALQAF